MQSLLIRKLRNGINRWMAVLSGRQPQTAAWTGVSRVMQEVDWNQAILHAEGSLDDSDRVCVFAHFDPAGLIREDVVYYLEALQREGIAIVFVSAAEQMSRSELAKISACSCVRIIRRNIGYDFGSWRTGYLSIEEPGRLHCLLLANDSVIGPVNPLGPMLQRMQGAGLDIWGMTDSYEIAYHVQSFFICFSATVLRDGFIDEYMAAIGLEADKQDIIDKYEVGLSQLALSRGYRLGAYCHYDDVEQSVAEQAEYRPTCWQGNRVNSSLWFVDVLLNNCGAPLIKKELLKSNPNGIDLAGCTDFIRERSSYPFAALSHYLSEDLRHSFGCRDRV